jgi:hypothetical protein
MGGIDTPEPSTINAEKTKAVVRAIDGRAFKSVHNPNSFR